MNYFMNKLAKESAEMGNLEGLDGMNRTAIVEGSVREMVVMGDDEGCE